ncbi:MAG: rhamnulokinase [Verrucomicrobia bacterium]|nr:rhamnulokinase [Verrucomicrobiota bacterium]MDE3097856.1 rhamnulokinase [Verrucomicrobiota bacterium]
MPTHYLACDLGADSGRLMLGKLDSGKIVVEELHRFPNGPLKTFGALHWNIEALFAELKNGLKKAAARNLPISSISSDSWGVDYVLLDERGLIMSPVWCYRDSRTACGVENVKAIVDWPTIFVETGIQFMPLNTIYQLAAESPDRLVRARQLLLIGNAFNYFCSGVARNEVSLASTTQLYNPQTKAWSKRLLDALKLREDLFAPLCPSGTKLGPLKKNIAAEVGLPQIEVVASCSHDTGAAVAAVPADGENWAYLSSGTWSLVGVEWPKPIINDQARGLAFTNETGYGDSIRLLKNIVGLWIVQECRRHWEKEGKKFTFAQLEEAAAAAAPFGSLINPDDSRFVSPGDMPGKIAAFCEDTSQPAPANPGACMRCIYESLALFYRATIRRLERLIGKKIERLHVVGGGSKDTTLNQFTANALKVPVIAGPTECTALGNILVQAIALGHLPSLAAAREVVRNSFELKTIMPRDAAQWDAAAARFEKLLA